MSYQDNKYAKSQF